MIASVLRSGTIRKGRVSEFHLGMFHGLAWRGGERKAPFVPAFCDQPSPMQLEIVRNCHVVPDVMMPEGRLVVSERVRSEMASVPGVGWLPVRFWRLFDYPWRVGDFSFEKDADWDRYCSEFASYDDAWFQVSRPDVPELHAGMGSYFELISSSPALLAERYAEAQLVRHSLCHCRLSERMLEENGIIDTGHGYLLSVGAGESLRRFIDPELFTWISVQLEFSGEPGVEAKLIAR